MVIIVFLGELFLLSKCKTLDKTRNLKDHLFMTSWVLIFSSFVHQFYQF